ncbi:MAG: hypothetical protein NWF04_01100 [Candidatus Bathyarchaeota archaeon]|nr:hypothetical protein [Candidatus Bathyarchaeota archaeon]
MDNKTEITDILSIVIITLGVMLLVSGVYLMVVGETISDPSVHRSSVQAVISIIEWIPGIPILISELAKCSLTTIGIASWVIGINLLLVGLGLWIRHALARIATAVILLVSTALQVIQFMLSGAGGSPSSVFGTIINLTMLYFVLTKFDENTTPTQSKKP